VPIIDENIERKRDRRAERGKKKGRRETGSS